MRDAAWGMFSDNQAVLATGPSTNVMDLADVNHQIGQAVKGFYICVMVHDTYTGAAFNFLTIHFQDAALAAGPYANTNIQITDIPKAALVAGALLLRIPMPQTGGPGQIGGPLSPSVPGQIPGTLSYSPLRRFVRLHYTLDNPAVTGSLDAWIDIQ